jgi:hypothetical protein
MHFTLSFENSSVPKNNENECKVLFFDSKFDIRKNNMMIYMLENVLHSYLYEKEQISPSILSKVPIREIVEKALEACKKDTNVNNKSLMLRSLKLAKQLSLEFIKNNFKCITEPLQPPTLTTQKDFPNVKELYDQEIQDRQLQSTMFSDAYQDLSNEPFQSEDKHQKVEDFDNRLEKLISKRGITKENVNEPIIQEDVISNYKPDCIILSSNDRDINKDKTPFDFSIMLNTFESRNICVPIFSNNDIIPCTRTFYFRGTPNTQGFTYKNKQYPKFDSTQSVGDYIGDFSFFNLGHILPGVYQLCELDIRSKKSIPNFLVVCINDTQTIFRKVNDRVYKSMSQNVLTIDPPCTIKIRTLNMRYPHKSNCGINLNLDLVDEVFFQEALNDSHILQYAMLTSKEFNTVNDYAVIDATTEICIVMSVIF